MTTFTGAGAVGNRPSTVVDVTRRTIREASEGRPGGRPFVTLTYAQSLDGSIASAAGRPLALSSRDSLTLTHALRGVHDAILVGIGCVLADDPRLTVRLVHGMNPRPVVVDGRLRFPLTANLLKNGGPHPWVATREGVSRASQIALEEAGAEIIRIRGRSGPLVDLNALLAELKRRGIRSVMVEGGARIITSFLVERLVDQMVITIAPTLVGGLRAIDRFTHSYPGRFPRLGDVHYERVGNDVVISGNPDWEA